MAKGHDSLRFFPIKGYSDYQLEVNDEKLTVDVWSKRKSKFNPEGEWRKLNQYVLGKRYLAVWMFKDGAKIGTQLLVHEVVCRAVNGEPKEYITGRGTARKQEVCHGPNGMYDNHPSNLRWGTRAENAEDMIKDGGVARGETHGRSKLTDQDVREIRRRYAKGDVAQWQLGKEFEVPQATISLIVRREAWKHVT